MRLLRIKNLVFIGICEYSYLDLQRKKKECQQFWVNLLLNSLFFFLFSFFVVNFAKASLSCVCCFDRSGRIANRNDCRCRAEHVKMETP